VESGAHAIAMTRSLFGNANEDLAALAVGLLDEAALDGGRPLPPVVERTGRFSVVERPEE
jgi:hypothetical protein